MELRQDPNWARWLDEATGKIALGLERREARDELLDHLEDRALDLLRCRPGLTDEEARGLALEQMGPAEPVRDRLAKIYDPLGGYLWLGSLLLAILAAGFFAVALFMAGGMLWQVFWDGLLSRW